MTQHLEGVHGIYFIGIGGVSMSALAAIASQRGFRVGGSDRTDSPILEDLRKHGVEIHVGHDPANLDGYDTVVYNAAIAKDNPEFQRAEKDGLRIIYRSEFLSDLMGDYPCAIGVSGMHGKSTTSALLSHLLLHAGKNPDVLIGAVLPEMGRAWHVGDGKNLVFEACEYRDSFLSFHPTVAVVLNIEMDHPDYFKSMDQIISSFSKYLDIPGEGGYAVLNADDEYVSAAASHTKAHKITFGIEKKADFRGENIVFTHGYASFDVTKKEKAFCHLELRVSGMHNVMNALAACAVADLCGIASQEIAAGMHSFTGASRRMEYKGTFPLTGAAVFDDFGHHPSEVKTTVNGAKKMDFDRVFVVYQPHTYSRTKDLFEDFVHAFDEADGLVFADIYAARETNTFGISSEDLAKRIAGANYIPQWEKVTSYLAEQTTSRDMILIMGAGDIASYANEIVKK